jgi:hypothetical protein
MRSNMKRLPGVLVFAVTAFAQQSVKSIPASIVAGGTREEWSL